MNIFPTVPARLKGVSTGEVGRGDGDSEDSILSDELRKALVLHGETPGPITSTTKSLYKKRLLRFQQLGNLLKIPSEQAVKESPKPCYSAELSEALEDLSLLDEADLTSCEAEMVSQFQRPVEGVNWREGVVKSAFTYLLLDPRVTCNLPAQTHLSEKEKFRTFVSSVFYIGKGQRSRPYSHLYEALRATENKHKEPVKKVKQIQEIWESGMGVVSLHIFLSVIPAEAYTREAAMIDAIGLKNLTNIRRGDYYGISSTWDPCQRRRVGTFLLLKAMRILLHEGERQLWPANL
ncbi:unnamed protein product [Darwinula stevensoni]|uniref:LEM domain-containing protein n=1 Tax=Darwinula stevensoni TaxID=69355 RepID=A0A7R9A7T8_9CRUS|nr:unnamed protein product [Darwinula stevensoni]CAG0893423.1 unnamed protein product [Darwinula stevensoni]